MAATDDTVLGDLGDDLKDDDGGKTASSRKRKSSGRKAPLRKRLKETIAGLSVPVAFVDPYDAKVIREAADDLAGALDTLARQNPRVKQVLESLLAAGAWGEVITVAGFSIVLPIAIHHRMLPAGTNDALAAMFDVPMVDPKEDDAETEADPDNDGSGNDTAATVGSVSQ